VPRKTRAHGGSRSGYSDWPTVTRNKSSDQLTTLLCIAKRNERPEFWEERGDVYCAGIEGSFIIFHVLLEFLGLESYREGTDTICGDGGDEKTLM